MANKAPIEDLFKEDFLEHFDFSGAPAFVRSDLRGLIKSGNLNPTYLKQWKRAQRTFIRWTRSKRTFTAEYVERGKEIYNTFFEGREPLSGNVLDIGGGWGLYREWWSRGETDRFIVHDPGTERFLSGPTDFHRKFYRRAFNLPMTFVEGIGELLPYRDGIFDQVIIASTLDHCMDPQKVLSEAYRCLRPEGVILIIQSFSVETSGGEAGEKRITRFLRHFKDPAIILKIPKYIIKTPRSVFFRLYNTNHHLYDFKGDNEIPGLLEKAGFSSVASKTLPKSYYEDQKIRAFEGQR